MTFEITDEQAQAIRDPPCQDVEEIRLAIAHAMEKNGIHMSDCSIQISVKPGSRIDYQLDITGFGFKTKPKREGLL